MKFLCNAGLGYAALLSVSCAGQDPHEVRTVRPSLGPPVVREGIVYTPVSVGSQGCVIYNIRIPGGQAPTAIAYQNAEGKFSYGRPNQCVRGSEGE